jgi:hypothetical protein
MEMHWDCNSDCIRGNCDHLWEPLGASNRADALLGGATLEVRNPIPR